jgi:hypothetical protein
MMPIMLLERSWSFNATLNCGKDTTKMLLLGTIDVDPSKHPAHARKPDRCPLAMPTRARQPIRLLETLHQP